jgi:hypothetical protein
MIVVPLIVFVNVLDNIPKVLDNPILEQLHEDIGLGFGIGITFGLGFGIQIIFGLGIGMIGLGFGIGIIFGLGIGMTLCP